MKPVVQMNSMVKEKTLNVGSSEKLHLLEMYSAPNMKPFGKGHN